MPGIKERVSEGHDTELRSPPDVPVTMSLFDLTAYGNNGYGAQPMGGESHTSQSELISPAECYLLIYMYILFIGYNGGYGGVGLGLGPRYGNGGMKGPKQGMDVLTENF